MTSLIPVIMFYISCEPFARPMDSMGGYYPDVMAIQTINLLEGNEIIDTSDFDMKINSFNIIQFYSKLLITLINEKRITLKQGLDIVDASKTSGGILLSGHNVIILNVVLLEKLLENKLITKQEGQMVIDLSKYAAP